MQNAPVQPSTEIAIQGKVLNLTGTPVADASVRLEREDATALLETKTDGAGFFRFPSQGTGKYLLIAEKSGRRSRATPVLVLPQGEQKPVDLILDNSAEAPAGTRGPVPLSNQAMEFADAPTFTVAGVTDWTAAGGHGADTSLRTSEALTHETLALKPAGVAQPAAHSTASAKEASGPEGKLRAAVASAPENAEANRQLGDFYLDAGRYAESIPLLQAAYQIDPADRKNEYRLALALKGAGDFSLARDHAGKLLAHGEDANVCRLAGELDEASGDPLTAVREFERAVRLEPSEENYFEWGGELLLHRALLQAQEVFQDGVKAYPKSVRMLTALGTALFATAHYEEAAQRFCDASDLSPANPEPYVFMGKVETVAPNSLACVDERLARFVTLQPENSLANYYDAMSILKRQTLPADQKQEQQAESLLNKAVAIDARFGEAWLQLGNLEYSRRNLEKAIGDYAKAIETKPDLVDAHYRLAVAYDRIGEKEKATQQFQLHDELKKQQAAEIEQQRREVKQFLVNGQPTFLDAR
jgi:tetratricopeptide (TPR) repeat protein